MSKRICIFGDSIAQGYNDLEKCGWPSRLLIYNMEKDKDIDVFNLSINGNTSRDLLNRIENELKPRESSVVIVNVGVNDSLIENDENWVDIKIFKENLEKILEIARKSTEKVFFMGISIFDENLLTPVDWDDKLFYYDKESKKYDLVIEEFCQENNAVFIPMQDVLTKNDLFDGLHPNAQGHEKIFQKVKEYLEKENII